MGRCPAGREGLDALLRPLVRRYRRVLRLGCLVGAGLALLVVVALALTAAWGVTQVWDWVGSQLPDRVPGLGQLRPSQPPETWLPGARTLRIPPAWEQRLGEVAFAQVRAQSRFIEDPAVVGPLARLAAPLLEPLSDPSRQFRLYVADIPEVNAYALPGGYIVFNRGLLARAGNAAEIQGVLAHEVAHVLEQHGVWSLAQSLGVDLLAQVVHSGEEPLLGALVRNGAQLLSLRFTRDQERAADDRGWQLLEQAGLDPRGMVAFFAGLKAEADQSGTTGVAAVDALLRTHPAPQERLDRLRARAAALESRSYPPFGADFDALQTGLSAGAERRAGPQPR